MRKIYSLLIVVLLVPVACNKEEDFPMQEPGKISINVGLEIQIKEHMAGLKAAPALEDFKLNICFPDGTKAMSFESVSSMPDTIELEPGNYYVEAFSDNNVPAEFENPYYYGASETFSLNSKEFQSIELICKLSNTIVSVEYSDNVVNSFTDYNTSISNGLDSLLFARDETRLGYFQAFHLQISVHLQFLNPDGSVNHKSLSGQIPDPEAGKHYQVFIDTYVDNTMANIRIFLDSSEIPVEHIEISDYSDPEQDHTDTVIGYGDLLITEIMMDPSALSDTEGEWFEIFNTSDREINLKDLVLVRETTNRHVISDSIILLPGNFMVLSRTATSTNVQNNYVYGSAISLPNTGAILSIYNKDTVGGPGELIFSLDYGSAGFPTSSGASICLNPDYFDYTLAGIGAYWCVSGSMFNTGDLGTPGSANDSCP